MEKRQNLTADALLRLRARMEHGGMDEETRERELLRFAGENMSGEQQEKMRSILRDRDALQQLLQSDQAQQLLKKIGKK